MPLWSRRWPFLGYSVEASPLDCGVYGLWKDGELIYIGCSEGPDNSIRSRLLEHFKRSRTPSALVPDHYSWEVAKDPKIRKAEMLEQFQALYGRLPQVNEREEV